ncbi:MAG: AAA family ATPase [Bacteroidia bacterium]
MTHFKKIEIQNFKKFDYLKLENLGLFNFIIGDNGIGKTSVLESLLINEKQLELSYDYLLAAVHERLKIGETLHYSNRDILGDFYYHNSNNRKITINREYDNGEISGEIELYFKPISELDKVEQEYFNTIFLPSSKTVVVLKSHGRILSMVSGEGDSESKYYPFIPFHMGYSKDLVQFYSDNILKDREVKTAFVANLKVLIPDIEDVAISTEGANESLILVWLTGENKPLPLGMLGEGATRLFRILAEIIVCKNNVLLIDEIDTGIHFSRFRQYLNIILKVAFLNNVQIFATTHSKECLTYLRDVLKAENNLKIQTSTRVFSLIKSSNGEIKAINYMFDQFKYAIENELEIRGGEFNNEL